MPAPERSFCHLVSRAQLPITCGSTSTIKAYTFYPAAMVAAERAHSWIKGRQIQLWSYSTALDASYQRERSTSHCSCLVTTSITD